MKVEKSIYFLYYWLSTRLIIRIWTSFFSILQYLAKFRHFPLKFLCIVWNLAEKITNINEVWWSTTLKRDHLWLRKNKKNGLKRANSFFFCFPWWYPASRGEKKSGQRGVGQGSILKNRIPTRASIPFFKTHSQTNNGWRTTFRNVPSNYTPKKNQVFMIEKE